MHLRTPLVSIFLLGAALAQACTGTSQDCTPGTETCICSEGLCLNGLTCVDGSCQRLSDASSGDLPTSAPPDGTSSTTTNPSTTSDPTTGQPSTTGPGDTSTTEPLTTSPDPSTTTLPDPSSTSGSSSTTTDASTTTTTGDTNDTGDSIIPGLVWYKIGELGEAHDVDFTPANDIAVVGYVERIAYDEDGWLGVLDPAGKPLWERLHDNPSYGRSDEFHAVAVDGAGNITAAGQSSQKDAGLNVISITWDGDGNQLNSHAYGHPANLDDIGRGVGVDADGNPYLCAYRTPMALKPEAWVARYNDFSGAYWNLFDGADHAVYDCEVTPSGYLVTVATNGYNASIHRWAPLDGKTLFRVDYKYENSVVNIPKGVTIDFGDGNSYVTGYSTVDFGSEPIPWVGRWGTGGSLGWIKYPTPDGKKMIPEDAVIDAKGYLRVVGGTILGGIRSLFILTYDTMGNELDRTLWTAPEGDIRPMGVAARGDILFIVGATSIGDPQIFLASFAI